MSTTMLEKIEALLRKAESTEFEGEREALSAKAEKLMIKYGIERARLNLGEQVADPIVDELIVFKGVYAMAWKRIAIAVAKAMGAQAYYTDYRRYNKTVVVTIVDFASTIEQTKRLVESLIAQAELGMAFYWNTNKWMFKQSEGYVARRSYLMGFAGGAADRITSERQEVVAETSGAGELVLARDTKLKAHTDTLGLKFSTARINNTLLAQKAGRADGANAETGLRAKISR